VTYLSKTHLSTFSIASVLLLSACGGGGGSSSGNTPPPPPPPAADTTAPAVSFNPTTLSVESEATGSSTLSATDANGISSGPTVDCTNGGSFDVGSNIFTAAAVTADTTSVCTAVATDPSGNEGTGTLTVTMTPPPPPDTVAPVLSFSRPVVSVESGRNSIQSFLTSSDNVAIVTGPTVTCTNGGVFNLTTNRFESPANLTQEVVSVCTATATDAAGNTGTATLTVTVRPAPAASIVIVSGSLTFDRVPNNASTFALDYDSITQMPIRQAPVELVNAAGAVVDTTVSDDSGNYSFSILSGENVRVRVRSEVQKPAPNEVDLQVVDNTSGDAVYALQGPLSVVPTSNQTRDLNADSGWGGSSYTGTRAAAPFALLDTIYATMEEFIAIDSDVDFPPFDVQWSTLNVPQGGNVDIGQISTSSFTVENRGAAGLVPVIRILGDANNDTDEYDALILLEDLTVLMIVLIPASPLAKAGAMPYPA